jgi:hypothetical protein
MGAFWGVLIVAVVLVAMLSGCLGDDPDDAGDGTVQDNPYDPATSFFVRYDGSDDDENVTGTTKDDPFATLAHAYAAALDNSERKTIVILSDLDVIEAITLSDPSESTITIMSDIGAWTLTRTSGFNDSVVKVTGGAKVVFSNIKIDGKNNQSGGSVWHRALWIEEAATEVTLEVNA